MEVVYYIFFLFIKTLAKSIYHISSIYFKLGCRVGEVSEQPQDSQEEKRQKALEMISYIESQIAQGKRVGAKFSEVEGLLAGAKMMIDGGSYDDASEMINQASQMAGQALLDYVVLTKTVKKADKEINDAEFAGKNVDESKRLLKLARYHMAEGSYSIGVTYAKRCIEALTQKKNVEIAWGSGLN
jgi:HEPN domain-containing protein